jgi:hypothetical protein
MATFSTKSCVQESALDSSISVGEPAPLMDEYILMATKRLEAITEQVSRGESIDKDTHDWMLAQVDFLTDSFGNENLEFDDDVRSSVLQLVLAIANLNEQIRHHASAANPDL